MGEGHMAQLRIRGGVKSIIVLRPWSRPLHHIDIRIQCSTEKVVHLSPIRSGLCLTLMYSYDVSYSYSNFKVFRIEFSCMRQEHNDDVLYREDEDEDVRTGWVVRKRC